MTDDRFDPELAERLRAYESRLPDVAPPAPGTSRSGPPRWPLIGVGALAAVAAVLLVAVVLRGSGDDNLGTATPSPMPSASAAASEVAPSGSEGPDDSIAPTPTPQPTASDPEATVDLAWSEVASFGSPDAPTVVNDVVSSGVGLVAVGVAYEQVLPNVGPTPPHEGRVWLSMDAVTWEDATPDAVFANATLLLVVVASDGHLIAHGYVDTDEFGAQRFAAWESADGRAWQEVATGFPERARPVEMAQGPRGHLAVVANPEEPTLAVWWSSDGRAWERVHELGPDAAFAAGAGDEGFVVSGSLGAGGQPYTIASGDGREWFEGDGPTGTAVGVAPRGGDWIMLVRDDDMTIGEPSTAGVWTSPNGLDWASAGGMTLDAREGCTEFPISLHAAGPWLVSGSLQSYPCSEGGFQTYGAQRISLDGIQWSELPFGAASEEGNLGTRVGGALEIDGRLVLVGERDRVATFWIGEQP